MSHAYQQMAAYYDSWMGGVDYPAWWRYLCSTFDLTADKRLLEAGCGTGTLTAEMIAQGFSVVASDLSPAMLAQAERKLRGRPNVRLLQLDMRDLPANLGQFDVVLATCDAVNYLVKPEHLKEFFTSAAARLSDGGLLLFDVHGKGRIVDWGKAPHHNHVSPDSCYLWRAQLRGSRITHQITGFTRSEGDVWHRFDELHEQRFYSLTEIEHLLKESGLAIDKALEFPTRLAATESAKRVQISARKQK